MKTRTQFLRLPVAAACALLASFAHADNSANTSAAPVLDTTVVTAGRVAQNLNDVIADMTIVDQEAIAKSGANSVADILARQPGIEITRNGGPASTTNVFVRGMPSQYTAVLIDGVRIDAQSGSGGAGWNTIPASQIERIEILRGPAAAIYGSDASAGVIQIFTKAAKKGFSPSLELGLGTHGTRKAVSHLTGGNARFDYAIGLAYEESKGFDIRPKVATANHDRDGYLQHSGNLKLGWNINSAHRLEVSALDSSSKAQYDTSVRDDITMSDLRTQSLAWRANWSEQYQTRLVATRSADRNQTLTTAPSTSKTEISSLLWHNEYRIGIHQFTADIEHRQDRFKSTSGVPASRVDKRQQQSIALGYGLASGAHTVQVNVRSDDDSDFGSKATGNIGYAYKINPTWRVSASTGTTYRTPTFYQRFSKYGKADLVPEFGRNQELAVHWAQAGQSFSATLYRGRYNNQLVNQPGTGPCTNGSSCYINIDKTKNTGLTLAAATQVQAVRIGASLDLQNPQDATKGSRLKRTARKALKLTADTQLAGIDLGAEVQAIGQRFDDAANKKPLGGYTLLNLSAKKAISNSWELVGRIDNLGDKNYETAKDYATAGRQLYIGLRWTGQ